MKFPKRQLQKILTGIFLVAIFGTTIFPVSAREISRHDLRSNPFTQARKSRHDHETKLLETALKNFSDSTKLPQSDTLQFLTQFNSDFTRLALELFEDRELTPVPDPLIFQAEFCQNFFAATDVQISAEILSQNDSKKKSGLDRSQIQLCQINLITKLGQNFSSAEFSQLSERLRSRDALRNGIADDAAFDLISQRNTLDQLRFRQPATAPQIAFFGMPTDLINFWNLNFGRNSADSPPLPNSSLSDAIRATSSEIQIDTPTATETFPELFPGDAPEISAQNFSENLSENLTETSPQNPITPAPSVTSAIETQQQRQGFSPTPAQPTPSAQIFAPNFCAPSTPDTPPSETSDPDEEIQTISPAQLAALQAQRDRPSQEFYEAIATALDEITQESDDPDDFRRAANELISALTGSNSPVPEDIRDRCGTSDFASDPIENLKKLSACLCQGRQSPEFPSDPDAQNFLRVPAGAFIARVCLVPARPVTLPARRIFSIEDALETFRSLGKNLKNSATPPRKKQKEFLELSLKNFSFPKMFRFTFTTTQRGLEKSADDHPLGARFTTENSQKKSSEKSSQNSRDPSPKNFDRRNEFVLFADTASFERQSDDLVQSLISLPAPTRSAGTDPTPAPTATSTTLEKYQNFNEIFTTKFSAELDRLQNLRELVESVQSVGQNILAAPKN